MLKCLAPNTYQSSLGFESVGYHVELTESFAGIISTRATEEEVSKRVDAYANMLLPSAEKCGDEGVKTML